MPTSKIYILESIDTNAGLNGLLVYGEQLLKEINNSISTSINRNNISCEFINIFGKYQWQKTWRKIRKESQQGIHPMVHIIAHGKPKGIEIAGYKELRWRYILQQFKKVNNLCGGRLRVTMNVCYAGCCFEDLLTKKELQFEFMLASPDKLPMNVFNTTKIPNHPFVIFYKTLIEKVSLDKALKQFRKCLPSKKEKDHCTWSLIEADDTMLYKFSITQIKE